MSLYSHKQMGFALKPIFLTSITILGFLVLSTTSADITSLIFKGCANQKLDDPTGIYTQNLKTLMTTLISQSSQKTFSTATSGDTQNGLTGLYQCRGDLTTSQCYTCISKMPEMINKLCGQVIAARVQLNGCYLKYEVVGFKQSSGTELLYKVCGSTQASGSGFEERRETAFEMVENGIVKNNGSFYTGSYQQVYVLGQCEGDLSSGDCGECVKTSFQSVKSECGDSISGQIFLDKCYVSYSFYPNGVPSISSPSGVGTKQHTQRTVAIAVGGVAAFGFLIVCLLFMKSVLKKRRGKHDVYY